MILHLTTVSS